MKRALALAVVAVALAGCGGTTAGKGKATLWVTRDRGAHVLMVKSVPAGLTAMQALERVADVKTTYAGRYVQAISGVEGSLSGQHDWFFFVNGIEGDRSAAEVKLHAGDIEWWDYRSWATQMSQPVVVGAFPEPFLHGPTTVLAGSADRALAARIARLTHGSTGSRPTGNVIRIVPGAGFHAKLDDGHVTATLGEETARSLVRDPAAVRFRYEVP